MAFSFHIENEKDFGYLAHLEEKSLLRGTNFQKKKVREKSRKCNNHNRQIQTSTNRTNVRKALRLALSCPSEVIAIAKRTEKHKNKMTQG